MSSILSNPQFLAGLNMMQGQSVGDALSSGIQTAELQRSAAQRQQVQQALPQLIQQVDPNNPTGSLGKLIQGGIPTDMATQIIGIAQKQAQQESLNRQREAIFGTGTQAQMPADEIFEQGVNGTSPVKSGIAAMSDEQLINAATIPELSKAVEMEFKRRERELERQEVEGKEQQAKSSKASSSVNVLGAIGDAEKTAKDVTATGALGQIFGLAGGTSATDLAGSLETIESAIGFDRLGRMREESKTGGALGNVSEREISLLKASLASLRQDQSQSQFLKNLQRVKNQYKSSYENLKNAWIADNGSLKGFPLEEISETNGAATQNTNIQNMSLQELEALRAEMLRGK